MLSEVKVTSSVVVICHFLPTQWVLLSGGGDRQAVHNSGTPKYSELALPLIATGVRTGTSFFTAVTRHHVLGPSRVGWRTSGKADPVCVQ